MTCSAKDWERADRVLTGWYATNHGYMSRERFAQELADVRREALEEAAMVADAARDKWLEEAPPRSYETAWSATVALDLAERIRALKDGGK
jgi:hypothetical protein